MIERLSKFEMNVHSQNGEDGVLKEILKRLNIKMKIPQEQITYVL